MYKVNNFCSTGNSGKILNNKIHPRSGAWNKSHDYGKHGGFLHMQNNVTRFVEDDTDSR
jgi:hypothetical protein